MKKIVLIISVTMLILILVVGCTQTPSTMTDVAENDVTEEKDMSEEKEMSEGKEMIGILVEAGYIDLKPEEAKKLIDTTPDLVILDVSPKYAEGHLPGAVNHYLGDGSLDIAIPKLDKSKPYLVYCHVDSVSISGATKLVEAGFNPVYRLIGNYSAWVDNGYPVDK